MTARNHTDPLLGSRLGDYVLQDLLGRGGMARVYRGLDENLGRLAAVKVLDTTTEESQDERIVERFKLEARAIASFEHPNIVTIYQYGESDSLFFIAMKLVRGQTLSRMMRDVRRKDEYLPPRRVLEIMRDVCAALDYAHERGIIHRDIKPSNILFDETSNNRAIITDFGLAMEIGGDKTLGTAFGTPRYISPEQAMSSQQAVPQSDIYSLGVVLFEMLTGQVPFQDDSPMSIALYHITSDPPRPRKLNRKIPVEVEKVVLRALAKEPDARYATAGDFYQALEDAYMGAAVDLPTMSIPPDDKTLFFPDDESTAQVPPEVQEGLPTPPPAVSDGAAAKAPERKRRGLRRRPQKQAAAPTARPRRSLGCVPRIVMLVIVVVGLFSFWWFNGQSLTLPRGVTNLMWGVVDAVLPEDRAPSVEAATIPPDVAIELELLYDANRFALHNRTAYEVPLDGLVVEWRDNGQRVTLDAADFRGPLPADQCSWVRLLSNGTLQPPDVCPIPAHHLTQVASPDDLFWVGREEFHVMFAGQEIKTCSFSAGRCRFELPH